jgi:hypothetical protein
MPDCTALGGDMPAIAEVDIDAFFRHRAHVPTRSCAALISSLSGLRGSDDPVVTFSRLPGVCVPGFADGCEVEVSDGVQPPFHAAHVASADSDPVPVTGLRIDSGQLIATPFRVVSIVGYPSYAGVVTHWWADRKPEQSDVMIAELMVRHLVALVDHERVMTALARAEDRAAGLALGSISGRTISLATGIVMHQNGLAADDAEDLLRQAAAVTGMDLHRVAASVVRSGAFESGQAAPLGGRGRRGPLRPAR